MKTLCIYDSDGTTEEDIVYECDVFRKVLSLDDPSHMTEYEIAMRIYENPQLNLVRILNIVKNDDKCYYDMEMLDDTYKPYKEYKQSLHDAIDQLHKLNVVYIDVKSDNIGFSTTDNRFKLFDFDCSGIVDPQDPKKWLTEPTEAYMYKKLVHLEDSLTSLFELDERAIIVSYGT
jgi:serine/threonine protein kinase